MLEDIPNLVPDVHAGMADLHHLREQRCAANVPLPGDSRAVAFTKVIESALTAALPGPKSPTEERGWIALFRTNTPIGRYIELHRPDLTPWAKGIEARVRSYTLA